LISLITLRKIYYELANSLKQILKEAKTKEDYNYKNQPNLSYKISEIISNEFINFEFFIKSIALIAFSLNYSENYSEVYKVNKIVLFKSFRYFIWLKS